METAAQKNAMLNQVSSVMVSHSRKNKNHCPLRTLVLRLCTPQQKHQKSPHRIINQTNNHNQLAKQTKPKQYNTIQYCYFSCWVGFFCYCCSLSDWIKEKMWRSSNVFTFAHFPKNLNAPTFSALCNIISWVFLLKGISMTHSWILITLDHLSSDAENRCTFNIAKIVIYNLYMYNFVCIFIFLSCYGGVLFLFQGWPKKKKLKKHFPIWIMSNFLVS